MVRTQRNAWIHLAASVIVVVVGFWLALPARDWTAIVLAMTLVWTAELINTALEAVIDLASPQYNHLAEIGKNVGAAAVLIAAFGSVWIGLLILGPPLWQRLQGWLAIP